jgi:hypothetical protein
MALAGGGRQLYRAFRTHLNARNRAPALEGFTDKKSVGSDVAVRGEAFADDDFADGSDRVLLRVAVGKGMAPGSAWRSRPATGNSAAA